LGDIAIDWTPPSAPKTPETLDVLIVATTVWDEVLKTLMPP
jgi:hypothetical protein